MLCIPITFQHNIVVGITQHYHSIRWIAGLSTTLLLDCQQHDCWYWCLDTIWNQHFSGLMHSLTLNNPHMVAGWWFGTFYIFPFSWECHHPNWLSLHHFSEGSTGQPLTRLDFPRHFHSNHPGAARDDRWSRPRRRRRGERGHLSEPFSGCHRVCRPLKSAMERGSESGKPWEFLWYFDIS